MVRAYIRNQEVEDERYEQMNSGPTKPPLGGSRCYRAFEALTR